MPSSYASLASSQECQTQFIFTLTKDVLVLGLLRAAVFPSFVTLTKSGFHRPVSYIYGKKTQCKPSKGKEQSIKSHAACPRAILVSDNVMQFVTLINCSSLLEKRVPQEIARNAIQLALQILGGRT